jgi:hypothetical protein
MRVNPQLPTQTNKIPHYRRNVLLFKYLLFPVALAFAEYNAVKLSHDSLMEIRAAPSRTVEETYLAIGKGIAAAGLHNRAADNRQY